MTPGGAVIRPATQDDHPAIWTILEPVYRAGETYCIPPEARGRGIARALVTHAKDWARAQGFRAMQFNFVVSTNEDAVHSWQKAGFDIVGRLPGAFLHPHHGYVDALVMFHDLTGEKP